METDRSVKFSDDNILLFIHIPYHNIYMWIFPRISYGLTIEINDEPGNLISI